MRGLNLSRLAARGRASEGSFFKDQQQQQASKLRASLSPADIASAKSAPTPPPSVDTLAEISGHSAYRTLLKQPRAPPKAQKPRPLFSRLGSAAAAFERKPRPAPKVADPHVLRALGSSRLNIYSSLPQQTAVPLPGAERYADGAVLGMTSFGVATSFVAAVGLAGGLYVYFSPTAVQTMRERSVAFGAAVDANLGPGLRRFRERVQSRGAVISEDTDTRARKIAASVVKMPPQRGEKLGERGGDSAASA